MMPFLPSMPAVSHLGETFTNVAPRSPLYSPIFYVTMGWFKREHPAEEPSVCRPVSGPRVPRSAFTLCEAARSLSRLCPVGDGTGHV
jgi:hypothetical protein